MRNIMMQLAYDGTNYLGWQKTNLDPTEPSVEYVVETTLSKILQSPISLQAASRTDRGVHALGQVINFTTENETLTPERLQHSLNCLLPEDIRALSCSEQALDFHATVHAKGKQYVYRIFTGPVMLPCLRFTHWHMSEPLDREKMLSASHILVGEHDFVAFRNHRKGIDYNDTVRDVHSIDLKYKETNIIEIRVTANNFLYKMCRNIVGTLVYVGLGKISPGAVAKLLQGEALRAEAGITAPAQGLTLNKVFYGQLQLSTDQPDIM